MGFRRLELAQKLGGGKLLAVDPRHERTALGRDPPDAAVRAVPPLVTKIDLAVLDDRVVPVGDVDRAVGAHLHVDRTERDPLGVNEVGKFFTRES